MKIIVIDFLVPKAVFTGVIHDVVDGLLEQVWITFYIKRI
jgi:hypothetical protein